MQIVIEMPQEVYEKNIKGLDAIDVLIIRDAIKNGTPLPKGHGKIADIDKLKQELINEGWITDNDGGGLENIVDEAPTIIEADKE